MGRIKELEEQWKQKSSNFPVYSKSLSHSVNLQDFMNELIVLGKLTFDVRVMRAKSVIEEACHAHNLIEGVGDQARWRRKCFPYDDLPPPDYGGIASRLILKSLSKREAFATVASRFAVRAASWEAAIAQVRRAWEKTQRDNRDSGYDITVPPRNP